MSCNQMFEKFQMKNPNDYDPSKSTYAVDSSVYYAAPFPTPRTQFDKTIIAKHNPSSLPDFLNYTNSTPRNTLPSKPSIMRNNVNFTFIGY